MSTENKLRTFTEAYRPKKLEDIIDVKGNISKIQSILRNHVKQHFLLIGPAGTGKTTAAWAIAREFVERNLSQGAKTMGANIDDHIVYLNASDVGIDTVRSTVKPGVAISGVNVFILDEFDGISKASQHALRPIMEEAEQKVSPKLFILTGNYVNKIIDPIISRCGGEAYVFPKIPFDRMLPRLKEVCKQEGVVEFVFPPDIIDKDDQKKTFNGYWQSLYDMVEGDMRKALKHLQTSIDTDETGRKTLDMTAEPVDLTTNAFYLQLDEILISDSKIDYSNLVDSIEELMYRRDGNAWESTSFFKETFKWLKLRSNRFNHSVILELATLVAEYEWRMTTGVQLQTQLVAMISQMRKALRLSDLAEKRETVAE